MVSRGTFLVALILSFACVYYSQVTEPTLIHDQIELFTYSVGAPMMNQILTVIGDYAYIYTTLPPEDPVQRIQINTAFDDEETGENIKNNIVQCHFYDSSGTDPVPDPLIDTIVGVESGSHAFGTLYYFGKNFYELEGDGSPCRIEAFAEGTNPGEEFTQVSFSKAFDHEGDILLFGTSTKHVYKFSIAAFKAAANPADFFNDVARVTESTVDEQVVQVVKFTMETSQVGFYLFTASGNVYLSDSNGEFGTTPVLSIENMEYSCGAFDPIENTILITGYRSGVPSGPHDPSASLMFYLVKLTIKEDFTLGSIEYKELGDEHLVCGGMDADWSGRQLFLNIGFENYQYSTIMRCNSRTLSLLEPNGAYNDYLSNYRPGIIYFYTHSEAKRAIPSGYLVLSVVRNLLYTFNMPSGCLNNCGQTEGFGVCVDGVCECNAGYFGEDCYSIQCTECNLEFGTCDFTNGQCVCDEYHTGTDCSERRCRNGCNGSNGECGGPDNDYQCTCNAIWAGEDCSIRAYEICDEFTSETECTSKFGCGWCRSNSACVRGDGNGPVVGACPQWHYQQTYQIGLFIVALIMIIIFCLMIINNVLSSMTLDYRTAGVIEDNEKLLTANFLKVAYWRDERSSKSWALFEQFQFIAYYALLNVTFPTRLIQFTRLFNWTMFNLPLPFYTNSNVYDYRDPGRIILNADQYANSMGLDREQIYYSTMFWFLIATILIMALYGVYALIAYLTLRGRQDKIGRVLFQKMFYVLTRIVLAAQLPITVVSAYHIRAGHSDNKATIAAAVITLIIFGILPILFNGFIVRKQDKNLLYLYLKLRYGAFYSIYHYKKARFGVIVLVKRFIFGALLGFLIASVESQGSYVEAQIFTLIAINVIFLILLIVFRPYLDSLHFILDIFLVILNSIALGIAIMHKNNPSSTAEIVAATCVIIAFVICVITYIHSWVKIKGRTTYICCMFKDEVDESVGPNEAEMQAQNNKNTIESDEAESSDIDSSVLSDDKSSSAEDSVESDNDEGSGEGSGEGSEEGSEEENSVEASSAAESSVAESSDAESSDEDDD